MFTLFLFCLGLGALVFGSSILVQGASRLASGFGLSTLFIGLTVVALGTSSPELAVSFMASVRGQDDIAVGNIVGSNIANILLIVGIAGLIAPLTVSRQLPRFDAPVMLLTSVLLLILSLDGRIGVLDGLLLVSGSVAYTWWALRLGRSAHRESTENAGNKATVQSSIGIDVARVLAGLVLLALGSQWVVEGAVAFAKMIGLSELVIGLTIVAVGTSLPEIATTISATMRGERDMAVGNVVGSNILNILFILGLSAIGGAPDGLTVGAETLTREIPIMLAVAVLFVPVIVTHAEVSKGEAQLLLAGYGLYVAYSLVSAYFPMLASGFLLLVCIPYAWIAYRTVSASLASHRARRAGAEVNT